MKKGYIIIDVQSYLIEVALVEGGVFKEFYVEYTNSSTVTGNIYRGKVVNLLPGLQSAFVDFGAGNQRGDRSKGSATYNRSVASGKIRSIYAHH